VPLVYSCEKINTQIKKKTAPSIPFKLRRRPANFWQAFCHNSILADVIHLQVHLFFMFSFMMKQQTTMFSFLFVDEGKKLQIETVTGNTNFKEKQNFIFNVQATGNLLLEFHNCKYQHIRRGLLLQN